MLFVHKFTKFIQLKYMLFLVIINACTHIHMWGFVHPKNATILATFVLAIKHAIKYSCKNMLNSFNLCLIPQNYLIPCFIPWNQA